MKKTLLLLLLFFVLINLSAFADEDTILPSEIGIVISIDSVDIEPDNINDQYQLNQISKIKILTGEHKGEIIRIENRLTNNPFYDLFLRKNDKVILHCESNEYITDFFISDLKRTGSLYLLCGIFFVLVLLIGRKKGFFSLISTILTVLFIFSILNPLILIGINPIITAVFVGILSTTVTLYLVGGLNYKSTSAVLGTTVSLITAGVLAIFIIKLAKLTGFTSEDSMFLLNIYPNLDFTGLLASTMIIASLGAAMDIAMSIASAVNEIYIRNLDLSAKELLKSGMNVGQDIIGTMTNTLILVYLGSSLPLILLSQNIDLQKFFNLNKVVTEISSALIGSIAIVICVPVTAIITAYLIKLKKNKNNDIIQTEIIDFQESSAEND